MLLKCPSKPPPPVPCPFPPSLFPLPPPHNLPSSPLPPLSSPIFFDALAFPLATKQWLSLMSRTCCGPDFRLAFLGLPRFLDSRSDGAALLWVLLASAPEQAYLGFFSFWASASRLFPACQPTPQVKPDQWLESRSLQRRHPCRSFGTTS